jgi:hypothetical protein
LPSALPVTIWSSQNTGDWTWAVPQDTGNPLLVYCAAAAVFTPVTRWMRPAESPKKIWFAT